MKMIVKGLLLTALMLSPLVAGIGCKEKGPMEKMGESIDSAAEKTGDKLEEGADAIGDAAEKAGDKIKDATN